MSMQKWHILQRGHWRTCKDGVFGLTGSLDRWKHNLWIRGQYSSRKGNKQKPWNLDDFNEEPDPPLRTLFGQEFWSALHHKWPHKSLQSGSLMVVAVKPLKRELELLLSKHEPHRSFIVPRTAWGSGWISEATCRNACTVNNHDPSPR